MVVLGGGAVSYALGTAVIRNPESRIPNAKSKGVLTRRCQQPLCVRQREAESEAERGRERQKVRQREAERGRGASSPPKCRVLIVCANECECTPSDFTRILVRAEAVLSGGGMTMTERSGPPSEQAPPSTPRPLCNYFT